MIENNPLSTYRQKNGVLVAAHRGACTGNIPCNTLPAFEAAVRQGADILETDLTCSGDGELLVFHPGKERAHLNQDIHLDQMTMEQIRQLRLVNLDNAPTVYGIMTADEFLETFKNRCLINLDHGWGFIEKMAAVVRRHGMEDQVLLKTPANPDYFQQIEAYAPDMMFMPIFKQTDAYTPMLESMNIRYVGAELVFSEEDSTLVESSYIESHHQKNRVLWCNPIVYSAKAILTAGHSDDAAIMEDEEYGWGWLVDRGFDILQTDWTMQLRRFVDNR